KHPSALLINEWWDDAAKVRNVLVDHGLVVLLLGGQRSSARARESRHECVAAGVVLREQQREVRCKTFTEPCIIPVALGDGVAEPLMCDFVCDDCGCRFVRHHLFAVEDGARVLGTTSTECRCYVGELFVRVWSDVLAVELEGLSCRLFEACDSIVTVLMRDPGLQLDALHH